METINLWESKFSNYYTYFTSIEDYFKYLKDNSLNILDFVFKSEHSTYKPATNFIEETLKNSDLIVYTDKIHPIAIDNSGLLDNYIEPSFFKENISKFREKTQEYIIDAIKSGEFFITIPDYSYTSDFLKKIIDLAKIKKVNIEYKNFIDIPLLEEDIKYIIDNRIYFKYNDEQISSENLINNLSKKELETEDKELYITIPISELEIKNFKYINSKTKIKLKLNSKQSEDEYLKCVSNILEEISTHEKKYNIEIKVDNRQKLEDSNILKKNISNVRLYINTDQHEYEKDEYLNEEEKLNNLIRPIKESNLSSLEKYLAVYNLVKQYKKYKENKEDKETSRFLRYILDNEYIVCAGFASLLTTLLDKVGISSKDISVKVDNSYDEGFTLEDIPVNGIHHARNLIYIKDDKYNIDGYSIADSTWDNDLNDDLYLNSLITFNRKKEAIRLEFLSDEDLLLDINGLDDFNKKINYYIKKESKGRDTEEKNIINSFTIIYNKVLGILNRIDNEKYNYFYDKYYDKIINLETSIKIIEPEFNNMITEYRDYIIHKTNKEVDIGTLLEASTVVKKEIDKLTPTEIKEWLQKTKETNQELEMKKFPFVYNSNMNVEGYLEDRVSRKM